MFCQLFQDIIAVLSGLFDTPATTPWRPHFQPDPPPILLRLVRIVSTKFISPPQRPPDYFLIWVSHPREEGMDHGLEALAKHLQGPRPSCQAK